MGSAWFGSAWFGSAWTDSSGGGGGTPTFAMRADQPLAEIPVPSNFAAKFRESEWDADLLASTILPDFLKVQIDGKTWDQAIVLPAPKAVTQDIIDKLLLLAVTERPEAMGEIIQQHQNFQICWLQLLNITQVSHPNTFLLMKLAARVGELTMIILKRRNPSRARPSQICPMLFPPVPVPGHATYPAGHALIGQLTSECLSDLLPSYKVALDKLAERVGRNRVIAGLHFHQDVVVGADVARQLLPYLKQCPLYQTTLAAAQNEWT
jgi:acid phosphatase (class A)